jgi:type 1 glutamine amidotransferase
MRNKYFVSVLAAILITLLPSCNKKEVIKTLIITGQSNHIWMESSEAVRQILDETGLFSTKVLLTPPEGQDMSDFNPDFSKYDLVVIDYECNALPENTNAALMDFVNNGGGVVLYNSKSDPGAPIPDSVTVSERHNFEIWTRISDHPVTNGLPVRWLHPNDEIVQGLKLAGENAQVLATAFSDTSFSGNGKIEPVLVARNYGKGRIFVTMIGTPDEEENKALHCAGFIVTLQRGAEWAATGSVTQEVPFDFPTAADVVLRPDFTEITFNEAFENIGGYDIQKSTIYFTWLQSQIRKASGDEAALLKLEKKMVEVLNNRLSTIDAKKLILKELSWMGTEYCIPAIKELSAVPELKDDVDFALTRLQ